MKTYKIIVLGASGSGKTFFLASMFKKLSVQNKETGFFLETDPGQRKELITKFREIAHPDMDWPPGTLRNEVSKWNFTCTIRSRQGTIYPLFKFVYLDYSGELITEILEDSDEAIPTFEIEREAKKADALLVLLDGQKILYLMQDRGHAFAQLDHDLSNILPIVNGVNAVPVHFVITKWDLLQKAQISLGEVRERLLQIRPFKDIVDQRRMLEMPTRLIPASALGWGFAELDRNGLMKKNKNKRPEPFQVETPLACILIDKYYVIKNQLNSDQKSVRLLLIKLGTQLLVLCAIVMRYLSILGIPILGVPILGILFELFGGGVKIGEDILMREQEASLEAIKNKEMAIESALKSFHRLIAKLEVQFPESDLGQA